MAADAVALIEFKKQKAKEFADANGGCLTRKQLASILDVSLSTLSSILLNLPPDEMIIKEKTPGGRGGILIPLSTAIYLIDERYEVC